MSSSNDAVDIVEDAAEKVTEYQDVAEGFVMERPLTALGLSFLAGLVLARILF